MAKLFLTGGTGYIGSRLIPALTARGHAVRALVRPGSEKKLPPGCEIVFGNALDASSFAERVPPCDTFVQLIGVPHPSPAKAKEFLEIDLASARAAIEAAKAGGIRHFVYVSVAQPAPVMRAFVAARARAERLLAESGLSATILRPWYVLGPGHRWPHLLAPVYFTLRHLGPTREAARRLGLVTVSQMVAALAQAVEEHPEGQRVVDVEGIRSAARGKSA